jgi:hypothetical protein
MNNYKVIVPLKKPIKSIKSKEVYTQVSYPASGNSLYTREQAIQVLKTFYGRFQWEEGSELECWAESENERFTLHFPTNLLCNHNEMVANSEPGFAWKCADCGYVYGK